MEPGATRTSSVLSVGTDAELVQSAAANAFSAAVRVTTVEDTDTATDRLAETTPDMVVVDANVEDWDTFVAGGDDEGASVPTLVVVDDSGTAADAIDAGATDVFDRTTGDEALLARRLANVASTATDGNEASQEGALDVDERTFTDLLLDTIDDVFYLLDPSGEMRRWNETLATVTGYTDDEIAAMNGVDFFPPDHRDRVVDAIETALSEGSDTVEADLLTADGERIPFALTGARLTDANGDVQGIVGVGRDVSRRKERQRELREQANLLDHIFNQVPSALYVKDEQARFVRKRNYDHDPDDYVGKTDVEFFGDTEYARQTYADDMRVIEEGERIINKEEYNPLNDEWVLTSKVPWRDENGDVQGLIGVSRLITEKKEFEQGLRLRNRAIEEAPIGICLFDVDGDRPTIRYANDAFEALSGYDGSSLEGGNLGLLSGTETDDDAMERLDAAFDDGESTSVVAVLYGSDRTPFWARVSVAPVTDDDGDVTHFVGFLQDVTDEKEHEQTIERRLDEFGDLLAEQLHPTLDRAREALQNGGDEAAIERATQSIDRADQLVDDLAAVNTFSVKSREVSESVTGGETDET